MLSQPEIVAHHFTEAGSAEPAIGYWLKAGNLALSRSANTAVSHLNEGLKQVPRIADAAVSKKWELAASNISRKRFAGGQRLEHRKREARVYAGT